jgi:S-formylglutathione hydrolase FrmB
MALLRIDHTPETVKVNLPLNIILPDPGPMRKKPVAARKVLYLLHGLSDDGSAWQRYTTIESTANAYGLIVVMPSIGRSFYTDMPNGQAYFTYLVEELPHYLENIFGLKPSREDTFIAGNSMGGYGAFKAAFLHPEQYGAAASFSGVLSLEFIQAYPDDPRFFEFRHIFGDLEHLAGTNHDPSTWFSRAAQNPGSLPRLHMSCGLDDDLLPLNRMVKQALTELNIPVEYSEEKAGHEWTFWDAQIKRFLASILG